MLHTMLNCVLTNHLAPGTGLHVSQVTTGGAGTLFRSHPSLFKRSVTHYTSYNIASTLFIPHSLLSFRETCNSLHKLQHPKQELYSYPFISQSCCNSLHER